MSFRYTEIYPPDKLAADKWNFQKEFLEDAFPGQDISPNVFNGLSENGAKDRITDIEKSDTLKTQLNKGGTDTKSDTVFEVANQSVMSESMGNGVSDNSGVIDDISQEDKNRENGSNWNPFKPQKGEKTNTDWNMDKPIIRDIPPRSDFDSKEYSSMVIALEKSNVEYRPIQLAEQNRTEQDIINRLSGGDMTKGSCSSLALAYAGNKGGYDVLDFRDGDSRSFFSSRNSIQMIADIPGVNSTVFQGTNDIETANQLLSCIQDGKEYYLAAGGHAAIVKRSESGYQYLELQHPSDGNGWQNLSDNILYRRFGCKDSRPYAISGYLIEVNSLANSSEFRNLLGYINTAESSQKKGVYGNVR